MSGERRDTLARVARGVLGGASVPYRVAVRHRNVRFDCGRTEIVSCEVPVISIGNLTTGGTGKTPIVCSIAKWFRERGLRVSIVSRGYGRGDAGANDEAMELQARLPDVPHVQDPDRVEAARIAVEELETELILMDDGFQHRRLHRDLDIVVVDATCPFGFGHLLPRGLLREPLDSLRRADAVIITRSDLEPETTLKQIEARIAHHNDAIPIIRSVHKPSHLLTPPQETRPLEDIDGKDIAVISAIGNPDAFERSLRQLGANIVDSRQLPDHDAFSPETVAELRSWTASLPSSVENLICTHKDLVKLRTDRLGGRRVAALVIELQVTQGQEQLDEVLTAVQFPETSSVS